MTILLQTESKADDTIGRRTILKTNSFISCHCITRTDLFQSIVNLLSEGFYFKDLLMYNTNVLFQRPFNV